MEKEKTPKKICPLMTARLNWKADCEAEKCSWWREPEGHCIMQAFPRLVFFTKNISDSLEVIKDITYQNSGL